MMPLCYTLSFALLLLTGCESPERNKSESEAASQKAALQKEITLLKQERDKILQLTEESIQQINVLEKKRTLAERAEQIRIKADDIELNKLYSSRLKKIDLQQRLTWEEHQDKTYKTLATRSGKTYQSVIILGVDHNGFNIQHTNGVSRIPFSQLSTAIEKECLTDPEHQRTQLKTQIASEREQRLLIRKQAKAEAEAEFIPFE